MTASHVASAAIVAPSGPYSPAAHSVPVHVASASALYVPAAQMYTMRSPGHLCPAAQLASAVHDDAPSALDVPAAHTVHDVALEQPASLYRPAGQSAQALQSSP